MSDERENQRQQVAAAPEQYPHLQSWEEAGPMLAPSPGFFTAAAGFLSVRLTYYLHQKGVLLVAVIVPPMAPPSVWRRYWTSHVAALREAEELAADAEEYLRQMTQGASLRTIEDLDYDDFLEHLKTNLNKEFH